MNRISRFSAAILLVGLLAITATSVWASPIFQGTVPLIPVTGGGACDPTKPVDMGTAIFTPQSDTCSITVEKVSDPAKQFASAPEGSAFVGDTFVVTLDSTSAQVEICYAYPPELKDKGAKIYKFNDTVDPKVWEEVTDPAPAIKNGTYCVTSTAGVFALMGNP